MPKIHEHFFKATMNQDDAPRMLEQGEYVRMENARVSISEGSQQGLVQSLLGTSNIEGSVLDTTRIVMARKYFDKIYWAEVTTSGLNRIIEYDISDIDNPVRTELDLAQYYGFEIDQIYSQYNIDLVNEDLLYFLDGNGVPRRISISLAKANGAGYYNDVSSRNAAYPPPQPFDLYMVTTGFDNYTFQTYPLTEFCFKFAIRYIYETGEISALSKWSVSTLTRSNLRVHPSEVTFSYVTGSQYVERIEILALNTFTGAALIIDTIDNEDPDTVQTYTWTNETVNTLISENQKNKAYDNIPFRAGAQTFHENILWYGDTLEGYDLPEVEAAFAVVPQNGSNLFELGSVESSNLIVFSGNNLRDVDLSKGSIHNFYLVEERISNGVLSAINIQVEASQDYNSFVQFLNAEVVPIVERQSKFTLVPVSTIQFQFVMNDSNFRWTFGGYSNFSLNTRTYKTNSNVSLAIAYYDELNRSTSAIPLGRVMIPATFELSFSNINNLRNYIDISISSEPPTWATTYKILHSFDPINIYPLLPVIIGGGDQDYPYVDNGDIVIAVSKNLFDVVNSDTEFELISYRSSGNSLAALGRLEFTDITKREADGPIYELAIPSTQITLEGYTSGDVQGGNSLWNDSAFTASILDEGATEGSLYYETEEEYAIVDGFHQGNIQDQTSGQPAIVQLREGNVLVDPLGSATSNQNPFYIEFTQIFEENTWRYNTLGRANAISQNFSQQDRFATISYSEPFVYDSNLNGLSSFDLQLINFKDLDRSGGRLIAMLPYLTNILVWQETRVSHQQIQSNILTTATGSAQITQSTDLIGSKEQEYQGDYGLSHKTSLIMYNDRPYWVDTKTRSICRLDSNGIHEISGFNMRSTFNKILSQDIERITTIYDDRYNQFLISIHQTDETKNTFAFSANFNSWEFNYTAHPLYYIGDRELYFSTGEGDPGYSLWLHNDDSVPENSFYGIVREMKIETVFRTEPTVDKVFQTIHTNSNLPFDCLLETDMGYSTFYDKSNFRREEEGYYLAVQGTDDETVLDSKNLYGIGQAVSVTANSIVFSSLVDRLSIGDIIYQVQGSSPLEIGQITSVNNTEVIFAVVVNAPVVTDFCYGNKSSRIEGDKPRDSIMQITLSRTPEDGETVELKHIESEVFESKV